MIGCFQKMSKCIISARILGRTLGEGSLGIKTSPCRTSFRADWKLVKIILHYFFLENSFISIKQNYIL